MNKINGYNAYQSSILENGLMKDKVKDKKETNSKDTVASSYAKTAASKTDNTKKANANGVAPALESLHLSDKAKNLLQELKKKYENADIFVAEYETDEEAQKYLSRGSKDFSILIDPEELERMAEDESVKEKNLSYLDESFEKLTEMKEELGDNEEDVVHMGITIGKDGEMSFFAELSRTAKRQKEFVEAMMKNKEENKASETSDKEASASVDKKQSEKSNWWEENNKVKRTTLHAASAEELLEMIRSLDWDAEDIPVETIPQKPVKGNSLDLSI